MVGAMSHHTGKNILYCDADQGLITTDARGNDYLWACSIDPEKILVYRDRDADNIIELCEHAVNTDDYCAIVIDAVSDFTEKWKDREIRDSERVGVDAKKVSQLITLIGESMLEKKMSFILVSHQHEKIGTMGPGKVVVPNGGDKLRYLCAWELQTKQFYPKKGKAPEVNIGGTNSLKWSVYQMNRDRAYGTYKKPCVVPTLTGSTLEGRAVGICLPICVLSAGLDSRVITRGKPTEEVKSDKGDKKSRENNNYYLGERRLGCGISKTALALAQDPELCITIDRQIRTKYGIMASYNEDFIREKYKNNCERTVELLSNSTLEDDVEVSDE